MKSKGRFLIYARDGFKNVCNHIFMSFSSVLTLIITLSLCAVFLMFVSNTNQFTRDIESQVALRVEFHIGVSDAEIEAALAEVSVHPLVGEYEFRNRYEEHARIAEMIADGDDRIEVFLADIEAPLHDVIRVEAIDIYSLDELSEFILNLEPIYRVSDPSEASEAISATTTAIRNVMMVFIVVLLVLAVFLIQNTIRVTIYSRQEELSIMRLVGGSIGHITFPFVIEGLIIGVIGAIVPIAFTLVGYRIMFNTTGGTFAINLFQLVEPARLVYQVGFLMGIISISVSLVGSLVAVAKYALKD
ncbi:MAG: ABC transporter permease [Turicibacter sp.]|nr:ABC transporter permease [Turicibacter sp.]